MNREMYEQARRQRLESQKQPRARCGACRMPQATCYCSYIRPFLPSCRFVILIHRNEMRRSIATGRMAHLCLANSLLLEGTDFSAHEEVNSILQAPQNYPVVLYPGPGAVDLSARALSQRRELFPADRQLVVFVVDGTWRQARRIKRLSRNLAELPQVCFTPPQPSRFTVRKQPHPGCYSTIEAIHHFLELVGDPCRGAHHNLLEVLSTLVHGQLTRERERRLASFNLHKAR